MCPYLVEQYQQKYSVSHSLCFQTALDVHVVQRLQRFFRVLALGKPKLDTAEGNKKIIGFIWFHSSQTLKLTGIYVNEIQ